MVSDPKGKEIQLRFIEMLKKHSSGNMNLADEIGHLLQISQDSAYRRLRCETEFSLSETVMLCQAFKVPLESLVASPLDSILFKTAMRQYDQSGFTAYLRGLHNGLQQVIGRPNSEIVYAGEDLPVFYGLMYPSLARFKMSYWSQSILNIPTMQRLSVEEIELPQEWLDLSKSINHLFVKVNSTEIWNQDTLKSTLEQFRYYWESGFFSTQEMALSVIDDIEALVHQLEDQAAAGKKIHTANGEIAQADFVMYASDLMIGNNCVHVKTESVKTSYIGYNTFNYMFTHDTAFNEQITEWLGNLMAKSTLVSQVGEKQRRQFFNRLLRQTADLKRAVENS